MIKIRHTPILILLFICLHTLSANTDTRVWHLADGKRFTAELVSYNPDSDKVLLKFNDHRENTHFEFDEFSDIDRAWLVEWDEFSNDLDALLLELGGKIVHIQTEGTYPTDAFVYYPSPQENSTSLPPAMLLFNAGGKAARYLKRHIKAAEAVNLVLISLGSFRNSKNDELDPEFELRFAEVFPIIVDQVKFDHKRLFMGGNSGGALRAFQYSEKFDWPWAGIYSNGGWLGSETKSFYQNPPNYPAGMRVALVNGNNDYANRVIKKDSQALMMRDCKVVLFSFEGGHQIPPPTAQHKAFNWLLEQEEFIEK